VKATVLEILDRQRQHLMMPLSLADFTVKETTSIEVASIINNPLVSLCCLDNERKRLIFAELPQGIDPVKAPFFYLTQFEHAKRLFALDYESGFALAQTTARSYSDLVFIHNIGRCGSTLVHQAFAKIDKVISISEPDCIGYIRYLRTLDGKKDNHIEALLKASVPLLFKAANYQDAKNKLGVIKLRNQSLHDIDLITKAFPEAKHLFLYRSLEGWVSSIYTRRIRRQSSLENQLVDLLAFWERYHNKPINLSNYGLNRLPETLSIVEELTVSWLIMMDQYLTFSKSTTQILALRYEELTNKREAALEWLVDYLELPDYATRDALKAFEEDSQAGTRLARPKANEGSAMSYSQKEIRQMQALLEQHSEIKTLAYLVNGTVLT